MIERIVKYPLVKPISFREFFTRVRRGCYRDDGSQYWTRREWLKWWWASAMSKWLRAPFRCKFGRHRVSQASDTAMGTDNNGTMDVWCLGCDRAVAIPIDDLLGWDKADNVRGLYTHLRRGGGQDVE